MLKKIQQNLEEVAAVVLLGIMAAFAFLNVITRYFIQYSFASTEEIEVACLVWLTMLGAAAGFRRGIHLGFNLLELRVPRLRRILFPLASILTMVTVAIIVYISYFQIQDELALNITSEALDIPQWLYTLAIPVGGILIILRVAEAWYTEAKRKQA